MCDAPGEGGRTGIPVRFGEFLAQHEFLNITHSFYFFLFFFLNAPPPLQQHFIYYSNQSCLYNASNHNSKGSACALKWPDRIRHEQTGKSSLWDAKECDVTTRAGESSHIHSSLTSIVQSVRLGLDCLKFMLGGYSRKDNRVEMQATFPLFIYLRWFQICPRFFFFFFKSTSGFDNSNNKIENQTCNCLSPILGRPLREHGAN